MTDRLYDEIPADFDFSGRSGLLKDVSGYEWDAAFLQGGRWVELDIYCISKLPHSRRSGALECLWACPRGEIPTHKNMIQYNGHGCCWGIDVGEADHLRVGNGFHKSTEYRKGIGCWITRNGVRFFRVHGRTIDEAYTAARYKLVRLQEHPANLSHIGWEKFLIDRPIYYRDRPAKIERIGENCEIFIVPMGGLFPSAAWAQESDHSDWGEYADGMNTNLLDEGIFWFREKQPMENGGSR